MEQETGERASKTNSSPLSNVQIPEDEVSASAENHHQNLLGHSQVAAGKEGHDTGHSPGSGPPAALLKRELSLDKAW